MIYTALTKRAMTICFNAHKEQVDKAGVPYVFHPFHLAEQMRDEETTCIALLHDVVEDSDYSLEDLRKVGFPVSIVEAVGVLTHDKAVPYMDYLKPIKENPLAKTVKLADLRHNSDSTRVDHPNRLLERKWAQYKMAIKFLETRDQDQALLYEVLFNYVGSWEYGLDKHGFFISEYGELLYRAEGETWYERISRENLWRENPDWMRRFYDAAYDVWALNEEDVKKLGLQFQIIY